jgi:molecular chaperone DnaK
MGFSVGIDLGTTNTVVAVVRDGVAAALADPNGHRLIPSVVSFPPSGPVLVGRPAQERRLVDPANTIYSVKRLLGRAWGSPEVEAARPTLPFELREGPQGGTQIAVGSQAYSLPEISAFVLRQAKQLAAVALGEAPKSAVITVPANFNDLQRAATKTAGRLAGLEVLRILNEPTAAALAYGPQERAHERVAVYDFGGGTFDVTLLDVAGTVVEVLATAGDTSLGGDDIDVVVAQRMAEDLLKKHRFDVRAQPMVFARLRILAEQLKRGLSTREESTIEVSDLVGDRGVPFKWSYRMTRPELERAALALIDRTFLVCQRALESASVEPPQVDRVILVGGSTRMPMVARKVEQFFGRRPIIRINPDEVVALGAAIQATLLDRERPRGPEPMEHPRIAEDSVVELAPEDEVVDAAVPGLPLVGAGGSAPMPPRPAPRAPNGPVPAAPVGRAPDPGTRTLTLPGPAARPLVFDQSEAAPQRPAPDKQPPTPPRPPRRAPLLIDVTPLSLGVETVGGFCDVLIAANTPIPCDRTRAFATATDAQTTVTLRISQGESKRFADNTCLGELELTDIPAGPRGEMQIAVTFEIDVDGILNVRARDPKTGRETAARIQLVGAPTDPKDIEAMNLRMADRPLAGIEGR